MALKAFWRSVASTSSNQHWQATGADDSHRRTRNIYGVQVVEGWYYRSRYQSNQGTSRNVRLKYTRVGG